MAIFGKDDSFMGKYPENGYSNDYSCYQKKSFVMQLLSHSTDLAAPRYRRRVRLSEQKMKLDRRTDVEVTR